MRVIVERTIITVVIGGIESPPRDFYRAYKEGKKRPIGYGKTPENAVEDLLRQPM